MKIKEWFQMMTLGQPYKYLRLMLWCLFDSIVMSIPYGLMLGAVYYLLAPLAQPGTALPTTALWLLVGGFLAQLIAYFFIRLKTYIDARAPAMPASSRTLRSPWANTCGSSPWAFTPPVTQETCPLSCCGTIRRWETCPSRCSPRWRSS